MRKASIAAAACAVLMIGAGIYSVCSIASMGNDVKFTEKTVYGDASITKGIELNIKAVQQDHIVYNSNVVYGENGKIESKTKWKYVKTPVSLEDDANLVEDLYIDGGSLTNGNVSYSEAGLEGLEAHSKLEKKLLEILNKCDNGEIVKETIKPSKYTKYYPLDFSYRCNNVEFSVQSIELSNPNYETPEITNDEVKKVQKDLNDFFRIPILDKEELEFTTQTDDDGRNIQADSVGKDSFKLFMGNTCVDDTFYLWFSNKSEKGEIVDTSLIPGGYGIYSLPKKSKNNFLDTSKLKCHYKLNEKAHVIDVNSSSDKKHLYISYILDGADYIDNVEISTGKRIQTIKGFEQAKGEDDEYGEVYIGSDNTVLCRSGSMFYFFKEDENGILKEEIRGKCKESITSWNMKFTYDGKRLAIVSEGLFTYEKAEVGDGVDSVDSCNLNLAVFDKTGLKYYGNLESSLTPSNRYGKTYSDYFSNENYSNSKRTGIEKLEVEIK